VPLYENDVTTKPKYITYALSSDKDQATPQLARTENLAKLGHAIFQICKRTDGQTYRHADRNTLHPYHGCINEHRAKYGHALQLDKQIQLIQLVD